RQSIISSSQIDFARYSDASIKSPCPNTKFNKYHFCPSMATASSLPGGTVPVAQCAAPVDASALLSSWANKYRGATVADLDLPPALSTLPDTSVDSALLSASSHDYSHLTVLSATTRALL